MEDLPPTEQAEPPEIEIEVGPLGQGERQHFRPGNGRHEWFKDLDNGPEMVVVPAGSFIMGEADSRGGRFERSSWPPHSVTIAKPFAIGRFTLTFDEWDAAAAAGHLRPLPDEKGWGRGRLPAYRLSWEDAQTYVAWLSAVTGRDYRLPSEAEWEYAARAGTQTRFWWGDDFSPRHANGLPRGTRLTASEHRELRPLPVDSFEPNPWGLYQVHGNVPEWCQDSYPSPHKGYRDAPTDGSPARGGDGRHRPLRGGSYGIVGDRTRAAKRVRNRLDNRAGGLRVVRSLEAGGSHGPA